MDYISTWQRQDESFVDPQLLGRWLRALSLPNPTAVVFCVRREEKRSVVCLDVLAHVVAVELVAGPLALRAPEDVAPPS